MMNSLPIQGMNDYYSSGPREFRTVEEDKIDVCIDCDWPIRWNEKATETETGWIHDSCQKELEATK